MAQIELKRNNIRRIIELLQTDPALSQADIARSLGLQRSTVSNLVRELKKRGWVHLVGKGPPGELGGKRSDLLALNPANATVLGFTVKRNRLLTHVLDLAGGETAAAEAPVDERHPDSVVRMVAEEVHRRARSLPPVLAGGIAVSSVVDAAGGIRVSTDFPWEVPRFRERLADAIPADVSLVVENDANCAAAYAFHRLRAQHRSLLVFYVSDRPRALGSGIIIDGKLVRGRDGASGEIVRKKGPFFESVWPAVEAAVCFMDPDALVITGNGNPNDKVAQRIDRELRRVFPQATIHTVHGPDVPGVGAAYLAAESIITRIAEEDL